MNQSPNPKLGALLEVVAGKSYVMSDVRHFCIEGNLGPFPKENFCLEVEKFVTSDSVMMPPCLELNIVDIIFIQSNCLFYILSKVID